MAGGGKSLAALPKTPKGRASRILQGLVEEAQFGLPFLESRLLQELLQGAEGEKAATLVAQRIRTDPYLAQSLLLLPLPPVWWEAAAQGAKGDPRIPLFEGEDVEKEDAWEKAFG